MVLSNRRRCGDGTGTVAGTSWDFVLPKLPDSLRRRRRGGSTTSMSTAPGREERWPGEGEAVLPVPRRAGATQLDERSAGAFWNEGVTSLLVAWSCSHKAVKSCLVSGARKRRSRTDQVLPRLSSLIGLSSSRKTWAAKGGDHLIQTCARANSGHGNVLVLVLVAEWQSQKTL